MNERNRNEEMKVKEQRVREFLTVKKCDGLVLTLQGNFAWATCGGDNHVVLASQGGVASVVFTQNGKYVVTTNIEGGRIEKEELDDLGFEVITYDWYSDGLANTLKSLVEGRACSDIAGFGEPIGNDIRKLLNPLTLAEIDRYRWLGGESSKAMEQVCREVKAGDREFYIAGQMAERLIRLGIIPTVLLVATDQRIFEYRHPIPTEKKLDKHAMLVMCAKKWGLIVSLTRFIHFGAVPQELLKKQRAVVEVDAAMILSSTPGRKFKDIFHLSQETYKRLGFEGEWKLHHQGGPAGYSERDYLVTDECEDSVQENQAIAWNPSITGTKSEDTILVTGSGHEILTKISDWPTMKVDYGGKSIARPDILINE